MIPSTLTTSLRLITYNICYSRRAVNEHAKYALENRWKDVCKLIQSTSSDVLFLQEVLSKNQGEVRANLADYEWYFDPTNSRDGVCCNGIGIKRGFMPGVERKPFSYN